MARPRIKVPKTASVGEIVTIKTLIRHRMDSGFHVNKEGNTIPRHIINKFTCEFNGKMVFACDLFTAISSNPYFAFKAKIVEAGKFKFTWVDDDGEITEEEKEIAIV